MGFTIAGSLTGASPVIRELQVGVTCYVGQLAASGLFTHNHGGHIEVPTVASEANENDQPLLGVITGVVDDSRTYDSTYRSDKCTHTTTQATIASTGNPTVQVALAIPWVTLIRGPICYTAYNTAPTVLTVTAASAGGTTVTHAGNTITDTADDLCTVYCRTGANKGEYRVVTTPGTTAQVVTKPFPYGIAVGDTFVKAACVLGIGGMYYISTANCIDGDNALSAYYPVYYHEINLEVAGSEYAVFSFLPNACGPIAA